MFKVLLTAVSSLWLTLISGATFILTSWSGGQIEQLEGAYSDLATSFISNFIIILVAAIPVLVVYAIYRGIRMFLGK